MDDIKFQAPAALDKDDTSNIIVLKFADSKIPVFRETRGRDYIKYGDDNFYPEYLTYLYNKSGKHNAILTGKANYIFGGGFENGNVACNRTGDTLNDISKKCILDIVIYGGFRLEIVWGFGGKINEVYHCDYSTLRRGKECGFYFKESWNDLICKDKEEYIPAFDHLCPFGSQIFSYDEYRPGTRYYPLPDYIGSNNYIETDIEISKYYLSAIRNGMTPSKMIQFYTGEPTDEKKKAIEQSFSKKFAGSENAGKFLLVFNASNAQNSVKVDDLSASDLDKHMIELNKTCQQEIFAGHLVTNPALFGIMQEGKLDGSSGVGLKMSYEIFQNTYAKPKADIFSKEITWLMRYSKQPAIYELTATDPIGLQLDVKDFTAIIPKQFVFEKLGVPEEMWGDVTVPGAVAPGEAAKVNDNIKNLTGRQLQMIQGIVRKYENENNAMTWKQAAMLLKSGFDLGEEDIIAFLGPEPTVPVALSFDNDGQDIVELFDSFGESKVDYEVMKSKSVGFAALEDAIEDEAVYIQEAFKTYDASNTEQKIIDILKEDGKLTASEIAARVNETTKYVEKKIATLLKKGYIEGEIGSLTVPPPIAKIPGTGKPPAVSIMYSYEGPQDDRNRPFCAKMLQLARFYSRFDIEKISQRLGYSVFDRRGGFWMHKDGIITPYCRHRWQSNIVVKKGGNEL